MVPPFPGCSLPFFSPSFPTPHHTEVQRTRDELRAVEEELPRQVERERVLAAELRALLGQGQWSEGKWTSAEVVAQLSALVDSLSRAGPVPAPVSRGLVEDALL